MEMMINSERNATAKPQSTALAEVLPRATEAQHVERVGVVKKHLVNLGLRHPVRHLRPLHALDCVSARARAVARDVLSDVRMLAACSPSSFRLSRRAAPTCWMSRQKGSHITCSPYSSRY